MSDRERLVGIDATQSRDAIRRLGAKELKRPADNSWIRIYNSLRDRAIACNPDLQSDLPALKFNIEHGDLISPEEVVSNSQLLARFGAIAQFFQDAT